MEKEQRFKIHFVYVQYVGKQKILRSKTHYYEAIDGNAAIEKVEKKYGKVKIWRIEKQ